MESRVREYLGPDFEIELDEESVVKWPLLTAAVRIDPLATTASGAGQSYSDVIRDMIQKPGERRR